MTIKGTKPNTYGHAWLNYDISENDIISIDHIIALILYCDFSTYCTRFSKTFRQICSIESMEEVKARNSCFWFQSKNFREVVEGYGSLGNSRWLPAGQEPETGPFFTGLDAVLAVPEFTLRLYSPTSTSKHIAVSLNFSKQTGMIIQLNNKELDDVCGDVSFFDVRWLSRFPDEDGRVFAGLFVSIFIVCCT